MKKGQKCTLTPQVFSDFFLELIDRKLSEDSKTGYCFFFWMTPLLSRLFIYILVWVLYRFGMVSKLQITYTTCMLSVGFLLTKGITPKTYPVLESLDNFLSNEYSQEYICKKEKTEGSAKGSTLTPQKRIRKYLGDLQSDNTSKSLRQSSHWWNMNSGKIFVFSKVLERN